MPQLSFEQWEAMYYPIPNPNVEGDDNMDLFETYGKDLEFVKDVNRQTPKKIWTLLDCEGILVISAGYHYIDRMNYFVTEVEWEDEDMEIIYCGETDDLECSQSIAS